MFEYKTNFYYPQYDETVDDETVDVDDTPNSGPDSPADEETANDIPEPRTRKEYYLAKIAGLTPTKKTAVFSGYGKYEERQIPVAGIIMYKWVLIVPVSNADENTIVMLGDQVCTYVADTGSWENTTYGFMVDSASEIWINVESKADAANKVVIFKTVELDPPQPKTVTEFYLAKMAGVEVVDRFEKVFEQEFTFEDNGKIKPRYTATFSNAYDETADVHNFIKHIDGNDFDPLLVSVNLPGDGTVTISTEDGSYAGTTHTLELFYKTVIEDVPVRTRTEKYLKAIAANQDSRALGQRMGV
jgi:hypothetical protein